MMKTSHKIIFNIVSEIIKVIVRNDKGDQCYIIPDNYWHCPILS